MQKIIEGYLNAVDGDLLEVAQQHRDGTVVGFKRQFVCEVSDDLANSAKNKLGIDISGEDVYINSNAFRHIENRHGLHGVANDSMSDLNDLARMGFVISNADTIEPLVQDGAQVFSKEFKIAQNSPAPLVLIKKKINGTYYCVVAATDGGWNRVWVVTSFINKKEGLLNKKIHFFPQNYAEKIFLKFF